MKSQKNNSIPNANEVISIPRGKSFRILTRAVRNGDAFTAKALMEYGAEYGTSSHLIFAIRWDVPAGGIGNIDWNQPDSVLPTDCLFDLAKKVTRPGNPRISKGGRTYIMLTDKFLTTCMDERGFSKPVYEAEAVLENDVPDEDGVLRLFTIRWRIPKNDVYEPRYSIIARLNDVSDMPDEIVPSEGYIYFVRTGVLHGIRPTDSYGGEDLMNYAVHKTKKSARLVQHEPTADNPSGLFIFSLQCITGLPADATWGLLRCLADELQKGNVDLLMAAIISFRRDGPGYVRNNAGTTLFP